MTTKSSVWADPTRPRGSSSGCSNHVSRLNTLSPHSQRPIISQDLAGACVGLGWVHQKAVVRTIQPFGSALIVFSGWVSSAYTRHRSAFY
ncbi:hypothetical protein BaRGS_00025984, partial [Batillaria attramentaria]